MPGAWAIEVYKLSVFADILLPVWETFALVRFYVVDGASLACEKYTGSCS